MTPGNRDTGVVPPGKLNPAISNDLAWLQHATLLEMRKYMRSFTFPPTYGNCKCNGMECKCVTLQWFRSVHATLARTLQCSFAEAGIRTSPVAVATGNPKRETT